MAVKFVAHYQRYQRIILDYAVAAVDATAYITTRSFANGFCFICATNLFVLKL